MNKTLEQTLVLIFHTSIIVACVVIGILAYENYKNESECFGIGLQDCVEVCGTVKSEELDLKESFLKDCCGRLCLEDERCIYNCNNGFTE